ncbi:MAG: polysaccharide biosynthesis C-terminal domain-containing protein, partial [Cetobacterium sp.]
TIFNLIGNYLLVPRLGAVGAAISTGFSYMMFFLLRTYFSRKVFNCDYKETRFILLSSLLFVYSIYISIFETNFLSYILGTVLTIIVIIQYRDIIRILLTKIEKVNFRNKKV